MSARCYLRRCGNDADGQLGQPSTARHLHDQGHVPPHRLDDQPTRGFEQYPTRSTPPSSRWPVCRPRLHHVDPRHHRRQRRLPTFVEVFSTDPANPLPYSTVAWTITAYTLALATVIPLTGWAGPLRHEAGYMLALALFTAGSALCATADSIGMLILFRVLQGLGGLLMPVGMTILTKGWARAHGPAHGDPRRTHAPRPDLRPILGGWLIDHYRGTGSS